MRLTYLKLIYREVQKEVNLLNSLEILKEGEDLN